MDISGRAAVVTGGASGIGQRLRVAFMRTAVTLSFLISTQTQEMRWLRRWVQTDVPLLK